MMSNSDDPVLLMVDGVVARIVLNNPAKHNSLTSTDIDLFIDCLNRVEANREVRVLVLTGQGEKTFCAGASLEQMSSGDMTGEKFETLTDRLASLPLPVICALNGSAYGGGSEIALCCDYRIGVYGMRLKVPAAEIGLCYPLNGIRRYVKRLGVTTAKRILIASEVLEAETLLRVGFLTHLVLQDELEAEAEKLVESLLPLSPLTVSTMKQLCDQMADDNLDLAKALNQIERCHTSGDLKEGLQARREGRDPLFSSR
ncbi:MAG: enoyl-CoA hydratase/isomerase family protein [Gammaproteobacteria bacterium]|nr:MAG: enoyl-CoA hydratase/isomerase family protein [Gammaproteobacteria bacterium]